MIEEGSFDVYILPEAQGEPEAVNIVNKVLGIHHVTAVGMNADRSAYFYGGVLGFKRLAMIGGSSGRSMLYYRCGEGDGQSGTLLTIAAGTAIGRGGSSGTSALTFSVPAGTLDRWHDHLERCGTRVAGRAWAFGEEHVCFADPDGLNLSVVEGLVVVASSATSGAVTAEAPIQGLRSVELQVERIAPTTDFLSRVMGFQPGHRDGLLSRFSSGTSLVSGALDILCMPRRRTAIEGAGVCHHVAWRVADLQALTAMSSAVEHEGFEVSAYRVFPQSSAITFVGPENVTYVVATSIDHAENASRVPYTIS